MEHLKLSQRSVNAWLAEWANQRDFMMGPSKPLTRWQRIKTAPRRWAYNARMAIAKRIAGDDWPEEEY